jgi:hypothetical protein
MVRPKNHPVGLWAKFQPAATDSKDLGLMLFSSKVDLSTPQIAA